MTEVRRKKLVRKESLRNLPQYRDKSDEEFDELYQNVLFGAHKDEVLAEKVNRLRAEFESEYDLSELLPNDRAVLNNLIHAMIDLDDYLIILSNLKKNAMVESSVMVVDKLEGICKMLRSDISKMQDDLGITRVKRKSDKEQSAIQALEDLKKKAKAFYKEKMLFVFCEKCNMLLATVWFQAPDRKSNKITVACHRHLDDEGAVCGWTNTFSAKELLENGGSNRPDLLPETMR